MQKITLRAATSVDPRERVIDCKYTAVWRGVIPAQAVPADGGEAVQVPTLEVFYLEGGINNGLRLLVACHEGRLYAGRPYADVLVQVAEAETSLLRRMLEKGLDACARHGRIPELLDPATLPGFGVREGEGNLTYHQQGWFTASPFARRLPAPSWAPEAEAFDIREGVYLHFPDSSCRLVTRREYYHFSEHISGECMVARQGDCLILTPGVELTATNRHGQPVDVQVAEFRFRDEQGDGEVLPANERVVLGRHALTVEGEELVLRHPEHAEVRVPEPPRYDYSPCSVRLVLVPGTSHPFRERYGD